LCGKNNENKIDYCNQCKKYICQKCKYCDDKSSLNHLKFRIICYKSIYTCLTHKREANIICKDCDKNVCSKCFDNFHKWHEELDSKSSDIKKAKDEIIKKNELLNKLIEFLYMITKVYEGHHDEKLYKLNIFNVEELIKKEKNNIKQNPDNNLIEQYLKINNIKPKYNDRKNYLCYDLKCEYIPEILRINFSSGKIKLKCNDNHEKNIDIIEYLKILEQKKDKNAKNNHTSKNSKDCNINI
jgi:hypothetical protein